MPKTPQHSDELIDALAAMAGEEEVSKLPEGHHGLKLNMKWRPRLNPVQQKVYDCQSEYILAYGERGSGKSISGAHKIVNHCVRNRNALGLVVVRQSSIAQHGGIWDKIVNEVLPQWKSGNYCRITRKRLDKGCGIEYTAPKLGLDKKSFIWISNRYGSWSKLVLITLFVDEQVDEKTKGIEPSQVLLDEAQTTESNAYLMKLSQQLGRRQDIEDPQQLCLYANPKGPSHWLWISAFCHEFDEDGNPMESAIDEETGHPMVAGKPVMSWGVFHVPISDNINNLPKGYFARIIEATKNDPIEHERMVLGRWIDKPEGDALFKDQWKDSVHLRGDLRKGIGIAPIVGVEESGNTIILGWDPGSAHTAIALMQFVKRQDSLQWIHFDELNYVGKYMPYRDLVPKLISRLIYWEYVSSEAYGRPVKFKFVHISDNSAFNQFRAKDGSFDAQDIEEYSRRHVADLTKNMPDGKEKQAFDRFIIKMKECPKGPYSVEARVRIEREFLVSDRLIVSATCESTRQAYLNLEEDLKDRSKPKRSRHLHQWDAGSYPKLYFSSGYGKTATQQVKQIEPQFFKVGGAK